MSPTTAYGTPTGGNADPFTVHVEQSLLDDLRLRVTNARLAPAVTTDGWRHGPDRTYLSDLVHYWRDEFDWRAQEREMARYEHFRCSIDGITVHFLHVRGKGPRPLPLIATHGWPWTFWDMRKMIGPLTDPEAHGGDPADSFDVVVPSLPGFAFSGPVDRAGVDFVRTADLWMTLMQDVLGYGTFAAHGGDWGAKVTIQMGHKYADRLHGIHVTSAYPLTSFNGERPWDKVSAALVGTDGEARHELLALERLGAVHLATNILEPQSLAYAMHDSPVGLCAWLLQRRRGWSDCAGDVETRFSKDDLLTAATLYWVTDTFGSSCRFYAEAAQHPWVPSHTRQPVVEAPTAISVFRSDPTAPRQRDWYGDYFNLHHHVKEWDRGGHFAAAEEPDAVVHDIREAFRPMRRT